MVKVIFKRIGGRIVPLNGKKIAQYMERINATRAVREFVKKRNLVKKMGQSPILKLDRGGVDVEYGSKIDDKFVKQFKVFKSDNDIQMRAGKDLYLEQKGLGPKTFYVKTSKAKYGVQPNITHINESLWSKIARVSKKLTEKNNFSELHRKTRKIEQRWGERIVKDTDKMERTAKMDMVNLQDLHNTNAGWHNGKLQMFDSGNIEFRSIENFGAYKKLLKLAKKARKNLIGKWED